MALELYKPDEATRSRGGIAVLLGAMALYGVMSLYEWLAMDWWQDDFSQGLLGDEFPLSPRVILCFLLVVGLAIGTYMLANHHKIVDFLISTENEMQKVSWPPKHEVISSSIAVCVTVAILAVYLGLVDYALVLFKDKIPWDGVWSKVFGG